MSDLRAWAVEYAQRRQHAVTVATAADALALPAFTVP